MRTIRDAVEQLYECLSFRLGEKPQFEKFEELFFEGGMLIYYDGERPQRFNVESFIQNFKHHLAKGDFLSGYFREISHRTDVFGKIAQCFSTYEFRFDLEAPDPVAIGIKSIQLIQLEKDWVVTSLAWYEQDERFHISEEYLS